MKEKNTNNSVLIKRILYIALIAILIFLCIRMFNSGNKGEKIELSDFQAALTDSVSAGTALPYSDIYASGGVAYLRKIDSAFKVESFPNVADFYFTYSNQQTLDDMINEYNATAGVVRINYTTEVQGDSLLSKLLPYISIALALFIVFMIYKTVMSSNKGAMSFGKSKARVGENIKVRFSDVAGADEEKEELQEVVEFLKNPQKFTDLGARIPKGVLLVGAPGTGKTLLARAIAGESNVPFFSISGSDFVEMFVGVGASRVRDLFDTAKKNMPCIVFIDEIDAVGRKRGTGLGGGNDEREQTLNQLLVEMDGFQANEGIIVIAATNRSDVLDPALTRPGRFDRQIYVHVPDVKGRENIIKIHAKNKPMADDINYTTLARITTGFTGADLENMLNEAAILAARANRSKIIMTDITEGINKVIMGPQKKSRVMTESDKKITAYHESGHAILAKKLSHCDEVQEVSIIPRGQAAGYTMSRPDNDDNHMTKNKLSDSIAMTMGGRIAEELIFEDISTGASSDIEHATEIARRMVTEWGMSKLGFIKLGSSNETFIGRDYQTQNNYSEKMAAAIDDQISEITEDNFKRAKKILSENLNLMHEMAKLLLLKNTIYKEDVDMLMEGKSAEEISAIMDKREEEENKRQEIAKQEALELRQKKEIEVKLKTAEVLLKAGVISQDEYGKIKGLAEKAKSEKQPKETLSSSKTEVIEQVKPAEEKPKTERKAKSEKTTSAEKKPKTTKSNKTLTKKKKDDNGEDNK